MIERLSSYNHILWDISWNMTNQLAFKHRIWISVVEKNRGNDRISMVNGWQMGYKIRI